MSHLKIKFGKRLKQIRLEKGWTQEKIADAIGVNIDTISNIERGIHGPKFDTLEKLASVLGMEVKELFEF